MTSFEYKVVPAPRQGLKAKGIKGTQARFANALETVMNEHGADGWEYQRTDTLPVEERQGLTGKSTSFQNMLVFRRVLASDAVVDDTPSVAALIEDKTEEVEAEQVATPEAEPEPEHDAEPQPEPAHAEDEASAEPSETEDDIAKRDAPEPVALAAEKRVEDTLRAPFAFPWNRRASDGKTVRDTDDHVPAE